MGLRGLGLHHPCVLVDSLAGSDFYVGCIICSGSGGSRPCRGRQCAAYIFGARPSALTMFSFHVHLL